LGELIKEWAGKARPFFNYSLPSERIDVAARSAATLFLGFTCLFLRWEGSIKKLFESVAKQHFQKVSWFERKALGLRMH
jgi:hypothetical protein